MKPFVDIHDVTHVYGGAEDGAPAVQGLSLKVREGEFAAIVGPSGCGKSTLMKLATGLQFPRAGRIVVDGREVRAPVKLAGMAFQNPVMLPWRTTLENLLLPLEIVQPHRGRIRRRKGEYVARAESLLAQVGLRGQGDKYPWQLSGGMQQRASLCRALIHEPKLLMLDEPFGALDAFTRMRLQDALQDIWLASRTTAILVTHDIEEAIDLGQRVVVMTPRPGRIRRVVDIDLPYPRDRGGERFAGYRREILAEFDLSHAVAHAG